MHRHCGTTSGCACHRDTVSPVGLAALVAALHLAVLAGRLSTRSPLGGQATLCVWRTPGKAAPGSPEPVSRGSSRPVHAYSAGHLSLNAGMAVLTLTRWLHIMRLTGTPGR
jgi:hypothetical protein